MRQVLAMKRQWDCLPLMLLLLLLSSSLVESFTTRTCRAATAPQPPSNHVLFSSSFSPPDDLALMDFSSRYFWEAFYKEQLKTMSEEEKEKESTQLEYYQSLTVPELKTLVQDQSSKVLSKLTQKQDLIDYLLIQQQPAKDKPFVFEWHDSIPLDELALLIPSNSRCLMVGCGNSNLPRIVLDRNDNIHVTLLDNSPICIEQLKAQYRQSDHVACVCASATDMSSSQSLVDSSFDSIVDKGLTDAFMCGEGWETSVQALLRESSQIVKTPATYLLVSYKMTPAVQTIFQNLSDQVSGDAMQQWEWDFDIQSLSNHRVSVSLATIRSTTQ
ncbi:Thiopurine S-methyltransferase (TPMT) [Seminavis robusta]|uniref:Thiopurine S-methyltransferase (TPMT) n=1 Tax=Seminavis robusta TaxID=568900 RepID=A0A9N8DSL6_9STRA|nr:Thiopurine S-methyltransferase (TPMT) [Seminavis robusta]|eukprot:Sro341_g121530.1 Thiopurine S-methyltransferase (TPMT) (329) ;mRNA; r:51508-52494